MNSTTALVPYAFEGHSIRVSTDQRGEAWFVAADVCTALAQHPIARALASLREEEHCLHSQEGPGSEGLTLALINEAGLLRLLLMGESPTARRMRHWLTHELLPAIQRSHQHSAPKKASPIEAIRRQIAAEVLSEAEEIIHLTGVSHAEALLSALEGIQVNSAPALEPALQGACCLPARTQPSTSENQRQSSKPRDQHLPPERPGMAWLTADQVADRLDRTLRDTNQRLAASGLQLRNDADDWQLTEAGRNWGQTLPSCSQCPRGAQILWNPAVLTLLQGES
jgi:prophage antirepressor-like protein